MYCMVQQTDTLINITLKDLMGGAISSPSTKIRCLRRTLSWRSSDIAKIYRGGLQLQEQQRNQLILLNIDMQ